MAIRWKVLGAPGADNALLATVDTGQEQTRLLFDSGEGCLRGLKPSEIQSIEHLFFSHFHMDHVSGFDTFFRHTYNRPDIPIQVWGPKGSIELLSHRFRSFTWNLHKNQPGEWIVREVCGDFIEGARFFTREAFAKAHPLPVSPIDESQLLRNVDFTIEATALPHHNISSLAYRIQESSSFNVSPSGLAECGFEPGPWLQRLTDLSPDSATIEVEGQQVTLGQLRRDLLVRTPGQSLAYLTDFCLEYGSQEWSDIATWLNDTDTLICECQYSQADAALAERNGHMTADRVGQLANEAGVKQLVLQHLSRRYREEEWSAMRQEAAAHFSRTSFPPHWNIA